MTGRTAPACRLRMGEVASRIPHSPICMSQCSEFALSLLITRMRSSRGVQRSCWLPLRRGELMWGARKEAMQGMAPARTLVIAAEIPTAMDASVG